MTKKIHEHEHNDEIYFDFINLNSNEGIFLLSYLLVKEMGANVVDSTYNGIDINRTFKINDLKFILLIHDYYGICIKSFKFEKNKIKSLRKVVYELLDHIKTKSKEFMSKKGKKLILASWEDFYKEEKEERMRLTDPKRIERICKLLENGWKKKPDQRLGQFLLNYFYDGFEKDNIVYHTEDYIIEERFKEFLEKMEE